MVRLCISFMFLLMLSCSGKQEHSIVLESEADLAGLRVATIAGSYYDMYLSERKDITLQLYNTDSDVIQALVSGMADVCIQDEVVFNVDVRKRNNIKVALRGEQSFPTGFMFSKESSDLADACTAVQHRMEQDGSMQRIKDFWLTDRYAEEENYTHIPAETQGEPLRVATASLEAPISFQVNGDWYGIEIDILRELARELHRPLEIKYYNVSSALMAVSTGLADVLCGCVFITPEREKEYLFAESYHDYNSAYFVVDREAMSQNQGLWNDIKEGIWQNLIKENRWRYITDGLLETIKISLLAILLGSVLGVGVYIMMRSRRNWVRGVASAYNGFMAGIPELVLLLILFYLVFAGTGVPADMVAVISFALFFASAASDIYSSSLGSIPQGQTEAGLALGFTRTQTFMNIILPQALKIGLPLYKGQCVALLKGTAIVGYIAIQDLTRAGDIIRNRSFDAFIPLLVITVLYFLLVWLIGVLIKFASPKKKVL